MNTEELLNIIDYKIYVLLNDIKTCPNGIRDIILDELQFYDKSKDELDEVKINTHKELAIIRKEIQDHAAGVQRVYNEVKQIKDIISNPELEQLLLKNSPEEIKKRAQEFNDAISTTISSDLMTSFYELKDAVDEIHKAFHY